jgi:hypothetical protein
MEKSVFDQDDRKAPGGGADIGEDQRLQAASGQIRTVASNGFLERRLEDRARIWPSVAGWGLEQLDLGHRASALNAPVISPTNSRTDHGTVANGKIAPRTTLSTA